MLTKEFVDRFVTEYTENVTADVEASERLMTKKPFDDWFKLLREKSSCTREIYAKNQKLLDELQAELKNDLDAESAEYLYDGFMQLYVNAIDDILLAEMILPKLIEFYEPAGDYEKLVHLYHMMAFETFEFYGRMNDEEGILRAAEYYGKVIALKDHYKEMSDAKHRRCIITAYNNLIAPISQQNETHRKRLFDYYEEVAALCADEELLALDGDALAGAIRQIDEDMLFLEEVLHECDADLQQKFVRYVDGYAEKYGDQEDTAGTLRRAKWSCEKIRKIRTTEELLEEQEQYLYSLKVPACTDDSGEDEVTLLNIFNTGETVLQTIEESCLPEEEKYARGEKVLRFVTDILTHIPYGFYTGMVNNLCHEWFAAAIPFQRGRERKAELLMQVIMSRQPATYIHGLMVGELAGLIARPIIFENPKLLVGVMGTRNTTEVLENKTKILDYIKECGFLHDVGKCVIAEVINKQSRRLSDSEFGMIKTHPEKGPALLGQTPDFEMYYDVMIGHHKFYDGTKGYPANFDNTASPVRVLIDLIAICDSIDAATDILGRNYTAGKNFATVLEELKKEAGTRYNPAIVNLIKGNTKLCEEIGELVENGRMRIYYSAYQNLLKVGIG